MRFVDHELTPAEYRYKFLQYIDQIAPEVLQSLKELCPKYDQVFNCYPYTQTLAWWLNGTVEVVAEIEPDILHLLDPIRRYKLTDDSDLESENQKALDNFYSLRQDYSDFLSKFGFASSNWLRGLFFDFLGRLTYREQNLNSLVFAYSHAYNPGEGDPFVFEFEGWEIKDNSKDFEKRVKNAFELQLQNYISRTASKFKSGNYKLSTKKQDIHFVKWLVYWTVKRENKEAILQMITNEDVEGNKAITRKTLNAHFLRFKKDFDFPVRIG